MRHATHMAHALRLHAIPALPLGEVASTLLVLCCAFALILADKALPF